MPTTEDNHVKFKTALVQTIQQLRKLNIRSAMNSGTDVLGKFYEVFLKYGNGAREIGVILTPRHITEFAVDVVGMSAHDVAFDPTCGTGGFLVAAFDAVKRKAKSQGPELLCNLLRMPIPPERAAPELSNCVRRLRKTTYSAMAPSTTDGDRAWML